MFALGALRRRRSEFSFGGGPDNHITPLVNHVTKPICWNPYITRATSHSAALSPLTWGDTPRGPDLGPFLHGHTFAFPQVRALVNIETFLRLRRSAPQAVKRLSPVAAIA